MYDRLIYLARQISPCILLLDNIEKIIGIDNEAKHTRTSHRATDRILSMLLVEIDGIASSKVFFRSRDILDFDKDCKVIVIATAESADTIDGSLLRSGRLEDRIVLQLPRFDQVLCDYFNKYSYSIQIYLFNESNFA